MASYHIDIDRCTVYMQRAIKYYVLFIESEIAKDGTREPPTIHSFITNNQ